MFEEKGKSLSITSTKFGLCDILIGGAPVKNCTELTLHMKAGELPTVELKLYAGEGIKIVLDSVWVTKMNAPVQEERSSGKTNCDK